MAASRRHWWTALTANLATVLIVGLVVAGMILGAIDSRPQDLGDPLFSGPRSGPPRARSDT